MKFELKKYKTVKFELQKHSRNVPESELIADVMVVANQIGRDKVTQREYEKHGKYSLTTLNRRFKKWSVVLERAGLHPTETPKNLDQIDLFRNIAEVWIALGRQPTISDMKKPLSKYSVRPYANRFGTWMNALEKFVDYENSDSSDYEEGINENDGIIVEELQTNPEKETIKEERDTRTISLRQRFSVFLRDGFRCVSCGKSPVTHPKVELHCDHIIPWSKGGKTNIDNLKTLCSDCNLGKGNMSET